MGESRQDHDFDHEIAEPDRCKITGGAPFAFDVSDRPDGSEGKQNQQEADHAGDRHRGEDEQERNLGPGQPEIAKGMLEGGYRLELEKIPEKRFIVDGRTNVVRPFLEQQIGARREYRRRREMKPVAGAFGGAGKTVRAVDFVSANPREVHGRELSRGAQPAHAADLVGCPRRCLDHRANGDVIANDDDVPTGPLDTHS
jgi:hypothetical protein